MNNRYLSKSIASPALFSARSLLALVLLMAVSLLASQARADGCPELLRHTFGNLQTGEPRDLCHYRGQVLLVVNTASYCGFTDQYAPLEALHRKYKDQGLVVLGFPSNDFGGQEPGSNQQIASFCRLTYGVEFPMFEKSRVVGEGRNALFAELHRRTGQQPRWNFHKYLIDRDGQRVLSFGSAVSPDDRRLVQEMKRMLDARKVVRRNT